MKTKENNKVLNKKKTKTKKRKSKRFFKNKSVKRHHKSRKTRKIKKKNSNKRYNKKVMKGGAIPFSELNPSTIMDNATYTVKEMLSSSLFDNAQHVPNNLPHNVNPSITKQYLDGGMSDSLNVRGDSPDLHFASS